MIIILKRVSAKTKKHDVVDFLYPEVKGSWFSKRGKIQSISIDSKKYPNACGAASYFSGHSA